MLDVAHIQLFGALLGLIGTAATVWRTLKRLPEIRAMVLPRLEMASELRSLTATAAYAQRRADAAENAAVSLEGIVASQTASLKALEARMARLEAVETRFDALADWMHKVLDHLGDVKNQAQRAGLKLAGVTPPIPEILKDRFDVPDSSR